VRVIVTFTRTGERRYGVAVDPPGAPRLVMHPAPGYHERLPHDLVHLAVELEYGIAHGVFGQVAAGGTAGTFHRADGVADRALQRRGAQLVRRYADDLAESERRAAGALRGELDEPLRARLDELGARWSALAVGEEMRVEWASPARRRGPRTPSDRARRSPAPDPARRPGRAAAPGRPR
jgi:hypothetical protein